MNPKKHTLAWVRARRLSHQERKSATGLTCRWVPEEEGIHKYFIHLSTSPPWTDLYQIWYWDRGRELNHRCNFLEISKGTSIMSGVENDVISLTEPVSVNNLTPCCRYCAASDRLKLYTPAGGRKMIIRRWKISRLIDILSSADCFRIFFYCCVYGRVTLNDGSGESITPPWLCF